MTLKELRLQNKKTVAEIAKELGVARSTLSNYEQGIRTIDIQHVIPLSKLYDCSVEEIITAQINSQNGRQCNRLISQRNHKYGAKHQETARECPVRN